MITAIVHHIKEYRYVILGFLITVAVAFLTSHMHALHTDNCSLKTLLQSAENENAQMIKSFKEQLQSVESTNERLADDKKKIQMKIDQISAELQSIKNNNQKLLEEKQEFKRKLDQNDAEIQSIKDNNRKLLEEKQEFQRKLDQNDAEIQSIKDNNQKLLEEKQEFQRKLDQNDAEIQSIKDNNQKLLEEKQEFQTKLDQNNAELQSIKSSSQEEKIKSLEKINKSNAEREVYNTQLLYIQKWMDCIDKLEEHIHAMIHCSESKKKESLYSQAKFCSKISYDFDERYAGEVIVKASNLNIKFKKECRKFLDALLLKNLEVMKTQQQKYNMENIKTKMEKLIEEVSDDKYQKRREEKVKVQHVPEDLLSQETAVQKDSGIFSTIYKFGKWAFGMVTGLFWS